MRLKKIDINDLDVKVIIINLYITQIISLTLAFILSFFLLKQTPMEALSSLKPDNLYNSVIIGLLFAFLIVLVNIILSRKLPKELFDDGGINEKLFSNLPIWHIMVIAVIVGFTEEFLFRGVIQTLLGVFLTSLLFTVIHFRYLKKYVLLAVTFFISLGLGYLVLYFGWFTAFIAHTLIDFILGLLLKKRWLIKV